MRKRTGDLVQLNRPSSATCRAERKFPNSIREIRYPRATECNIEGHVVTFEGRLKGFLLTEPHKFVVATCSALPQAAEASWARIVLICHGTGASSACGLVPIRVADAVTSRLLEHLAGHCRAQTGTLR
jgi:hypothetical protein